MKIRKVDASGDWQYGKGFSSYATGQLAIAQNIQTRLLSWKNDCFFAMDDFVDWQARLDKGQRDNLLIEVKRIILTSEGVVGINELTVDLGPTRLMTIAYSVDTIYGINFQQQVAQQG